MGEIIGRVKVRKLVGWDKYSLVNKAKAAHTSKAKSGIHSLLPISKQVFNHVQESRAPSDITVTWQYKYHNSKCPPFPSSSHSFLCWAWYLMVCDILLVSWGQLCSPILSQLTVHHQPTHWQGSLRGREALRLCKHCSAITKTSQCYKRCVHHKSKT